MNDSNLPRVYVAGKLSAMACDYIVNINRMVRTAEVIRRRGFAVYIPALDLLWGLIVGDLDYEDYFNNSQPWLAVADALFVLPGSEASDGTQREILLARKLKIPVVHTLAQLLRLRDNHKLGEQQ